MVARPEPPADRRAGGWRLAESTSAYLQSASEQPIEWFPWGNDAFETARRLHRPILLDIGAAWCHWCHVMDEGTYSDLEVARLIRQHFVAVKVDRDQNPEVDRRYQRQVSALTGEGGWPLTAFLNAMGEVFLGGTYYPPQDGMGRPGFRRVLKEVARVWGDEPDKVASNASAVKEALGRIRARESGPAVGLDQFIASTAIHIHETFDGVNGGFGQAPKFPHPTAVSFLLFDSYRTGEPIGAERARLTLERMADGGVYDQLAGGFHRYSVDEGWHVPHFEKMGVDNAALLSVYAEGVRRFGVPRFEETVRGILGWTENVLGDPAGGFGTSQDADNAPGDDGGYFTWSRGELKSVLDATELRLVSRYFGLGTEGRMGHDPDQNVLYRLQPLAEAAQGLELPGSDPAATLNRALEKMRAARAARPTPTVDRALYAGLNGSFIRALSSAGATLGDSATIALARRAADRFIQSAYDPLRGFAHRLDPDGPHGYGLLEDQVEMALGLVELGGTTMESRYVAVAQELLDLVDREFKGDNGLLRDIAPRLYDGPNLGTVPEPQYPLEDNPHLSANAAAALAGIRLSALTGDPLARTRAKDLVGSITGHVRSAGLFAAGAALAAGLIDVPPARVVVEGSGAAVDKLFRAAARSWHPNVWAFRGVPPAPFSSPEELTAAAHAGTEPRALVCFGTRCLPPVTSADELAALLLDAGRPVPS